MDKKLEEAENEKILRHEQTCKEYSKRLAYYEKTEKLRVQYYEKEEKLRFQFKNNMSKWEEEDSVLYREAIEQRDMITQERGTFVPQNREEMIIQKRIYLYGSQCPKRNNIMKLLHSQGLQSAIGLNFSMYMTGFKINISRDNPDQKNFYYEVVQDGIILTNSEYEGRFIFK